MGYTSHMSFEKWRWNIVAWIITKLVWSRMIPSVSMFLSFYIGDHATLMFFSIYCKYVYTHNTYILHTHIYVYTVSIVSFWQFYVNFYI